MKLRELNDKAVETSKEIEKLWLKLYKLQDEISAELKMPDARWLMNNLISVKDMPEWSSVRQFKDSDGKELYQYEKYVDGIKIVCFKECEEDGATV